MGLDIINNQSALSAEYNLNQSTAAEANAITKLSSGYKINKAADDSAGLVISDHLNEEITGYQQASSNAQNAISVVQTADGALNEVTAILNRVYQLANQAANQSAQDSTSTAAAAQEIKQSLADIDQISQQTQFGSSQLLWTAAVRPARHHRLHLPGRVGLGQLQPGDAVDHRHLLGRAEPERLHVGVGGHQRGRHRGDELGQCCPADGRHRARCARCRSEPDPAPVEQPGCRCAEPDLGRVVLQGHRHGREMVTFTKDQILQQAGVSMLAQANQSCQPSSSSSANRILVAD